MSCSLALLFLLELQEKNGVSFLYEGSCCASIPIIRNLEEYYDNDLLTSIETDIILHNSTMEGNGVIMEHD